MSSCGRLVLIKYSVMFQSRLDPEPWLKPYTDQEFAAFVSDCLETLGEMGMRGREYFLGAGEKKLTLIPCLNDHLAWITALETFVSRVFAPAPRSPETTGVT